MPSKEWVQATPQEKSPRELEKRFPFSFVKFPIAKIKVREKHFREAIEKPIEKWKGNRKGWGTNIEK